MRIKKSSVWRNGFGFGLVAVTCFSLTLPATRMAVQTLDPIFVGFARASLAGVLASCLLLIRREPWPNRKEWKPLCVVAGGVVFGFPIFSAIAMKGLPSVYGAVIFALAPIATSLMATLVFKEKATKFFWAGLSLGVSTLLGYLYFFRGVRLGLGDWALFVAVLCGGVGYAQGGQLAKQTSGWKVISWALVISLPVTALMTAISRPKDLAVVSSPSVLGFLYLAIVSQFTAFFFWYEGLARGGVARIGQLQLLQPLMTFVVSATFLKEVIDAPMVVTIMIVLGSVYLSKKQVDL